MKRLVIFLVLMHIFVAVSAGNKEIKLSEDGEASLKVFFPDKPNGMAVLVLPGGGYHHLCMNHEGYDWVQFFVDKGFVCCVLKYRMPKGNPLIPIHDAENAIKVIKEMQPISWKKIGIMGSSAGGHLAAIVANGEDDKIRPDFCILLYPVISMDVKKSHKRSVDEFCGKKYCEGGFVAKYSAENLITDQTPTTFLALSSNDTVVPPMTNALTYVDSLVKHHVDVSLHIYPSGGHGFGYNHSFIYHAQMTEELSKWLSEIESPTTPRLAMLSYILPPPTSMYIICINVLLLLIALVMFYFIRHKRYVR